MTIKDTISNAALLATAVKQDQYPSGDLPEVAFVGRSNVGKSSLINALLGRKLLARTSQHPGKTRTINFYDIEGKLVFVDLPGYGYAKVSREQSQSWGPMIEAYLRHREQLQIVMLLLDIRHPPSQNDMQMHEWLLYYNCNIQLVATKADKLSRSQVQKQLGIIAKALGTPPSDIIAFSAETKQGREDLWGKITNSGG